MRYGFHRLVKLRILFQDACYVAVDKPAGLLVHRSPLDANARVFALQLLRDQLSQPVYPCHRLDRPTSGVLLFALDAASLRFTQQELAAQSCEKTYRAVVRGWTKDFGQIDYNLRSEEPPHKVQSARTDFRTLQRSEVSIPVGRYPQARFSLLELSPVTGRKHQLRRHLAHVRHPIIGDTRHGDGAQNRFLRSHCGEQRLLLRATSITFTHQKTGSRIVVDAGPEESFERILKRLALA